MSNSIGTALAPEEGCWHPAAAWTLHTWWHCSVCSIPPSALPVLILAEDVTEVHALQHFNLQVRSIWGTISMSRITFIKEPFELGSLSFLMVFIYEFWGASYNKTEMFAQKAEVGQVLTPRAVLSPPFFAAEHHGCSVNTVALWLWGAAGAGGACM